MKLKQIFWVLPVTFALCGPAHGETLKQAMALAYTTSPLLQAERAGLRATDEQLAQARSKRLPSARIDGNLGYTRVKQASPFFSNVSTFRPRSVSAVASQTLYGGGGISGGIEAAKASIAAGRANLVGVEQSVLLDAATAYLDVLRDEDVVRIRQNNVNVLEQQHKAAQDRFDVGEITRTDVSQAVARVAGARAQLEAARSALANSRATYQRVIGRPPATLEKATTPGGVPDDVMAARQIAEHEAPAIIAARHAEEAARKQISVARAGLRPSVSVDVSGNSADSTGLPGQRLRSAAATARISVPLFTGGLSQSQVREAKHKDSQARLQLAQTRRLVDEQVAQAWSVLVAARAVIVSSREQVKANTLAFEGVEQEARVGLRTTLDVLDAEQELLNAKLALVTAERDESVAAYGLLAAMGELTARKLALKVVYYKPESYEKTGLKGLFSTGIDE